MPNTAIYVSTRRDSERVQKYLFSKGWHWHGGVTFCLESTVGLCISIEDSFNKKQLEYCRTSFYLERNFTVLTATEFFALENKGNHVCGAILCKECMKDVREHLSF